jgi:hypothetical protein
VAVIREPSRGGGPPGALLMLAFGLLGATASAVMLHTLLAPTPLPAALNLGPQPPAIPGYRLQPLVGTPAAAGRRLSHSGVRSFAVQAVDGGPVLQLSLVNLHSRSHHSFQLAGLTSGSGAPSGLALQKRRLQPGVVATAIGTLAAGSGQPARMALQSCLIGERGGVTQQQLADATKPKLTPWHDHRWECLLVSVSAPAGAPGAEVALQEFWSTATPRLGRLVP